MTAGAPDFGATVFFGKAAFGFAAYRHEAYLTYGGEGTWLPLPSWAFALAFLALALLEWWFFRLLVRLIRRLWSRRKG